MDPSTRMSSSIGYGISTWLSSDAGIRPTRVPSITPGQRGVSRAAILRSLWNSLRPDRAEPDLARELGAHLVLMQDEYEGRGMNPEEAYRAARIAMGGVEQTKELHCDARSFIWLNDARQDVAHSVRLSDARHVPNFQNARMANCGAE